MNLTESNESTQGATVSELRNFGFIMSAMLLIFFGVLLTWVFGFATSIYVFVLSGVFFVPALLHPPILNWPYRVWMIFAHYLGVFNTRLILTLLFVFVVIPISIPFRFTYRNKNKVFEQSKSLWKKSEKRSSDNLEKMF